MLTEKDIIWSERRHFAREDPDDDKSPMVLTDSLIIEGCTEDGKIRCPHMLTTLELNHAIFPEGLRAHAKEIILRKINLYTGRELGIPAKR